MQWPAYSQWRYMTNFYIIHSIWTFDQFSRTHSHTGISINLHFFAAIHAYHLYWRQEKNTLTKSSECEFYLSSLLIQVFCLFVLAHRWKVIQFMELKINSRICVRQPSYFFKIYNATLQALESDIEFFSRTLIHVLFHSWTCIKWFVKRMLKSVIWGNLQDFLSSFDIFEL